MFSAGSRVRMENTGFPFSMQYGAVKLTTPMFKNKPKEPLNNKPYILVKHAIQAFFQNTGLIFTQICLFSLVSCFLFCKRADFLFDLCCGKFSTGNRQRIQIGTGKQGIQTIFVFL